MTVNEGKIDRALRIVAGIALIAFALFGPATPYTWLGWIGIVPLVTGLIGFCPAYRILGISTCPMKAKDA